MIVYRISTRLVPKNNEVKMILSAGTYSIEQFNQNMQEAIKGKRDQWVAPQIKDYKLIIPENHTFIALKPFFDTLGINPGGVGIGNGEYQTSLKPPPKKIGFALRRD